MDCETNTIDFYDMRHNNNKYQRVRTDGELSSGAWFYSRKYDNLYLIALL